MLYKFSIYTIPRSLSLALSLSLSLSLSTTAVLLLNHCLTIYLTNYFILFTMPPSLQQLQLVFYYIFY